MDHECSLLQCSKVRGEGCATAKSEGKGVLLDSMSSEAWW